MYNLRKKLIKFLFFRPIIADLKKPFFSTNNCCSKLNNSHLISKLKYSNYIIHRNELFQIDKNNCYFRNCQVSNQPLDCNNEKCWKCGIALITIKHHPEFFCKDCGCIQPLSSNLNIFNLFEIQEMKFDVNLNEIENKYKKLQLLIHPDKYVNKTEKEKEYADIISSRLNKAYRKIKDPLARAKYILKIKGYEFDNDKTINDKEFLMEMMDIQEKVFEENDKNVLREMNNENQKNQIEIINEISKALLSDDLDKTSILIIKLSYLYRIKEHINNKL